MKKLRSDARWHTLTPEQQKKIEQWLFTDHFSFRKTHQLMKTELGIQCALSTIGPMYHYLDDLRADSAFLNAGDFAAQTLNSGASFEKLHSASKLLLASRFLRSMTENADTADIVRLGRLMLQHESSEILQDRMALLAQRFDISRAESAFARLTKADLTEPKASLSEP
jgi:hypothetical protein